MKTANETHASSLFVEDDPLPVESVNEHGHSPIFLTCEHAGRAIPSALGDLGLSEVEMEHHIAYDIGAEAVARRLSRGLDAPLILQPYSRLVIDCNRPVNGKDWVPRVSDNIIIPANQKASAAEIQQRFEHIHKPFHAEIDRQLDARLAAGIPTMLISVHSFTPKLFSRGGNRPWHLGLLYSRDDRLASRLMPVLNRHAPHLQIACNEPYTVNDWSDYTIPVHGERRAIPHVLLEIRNDQIASAAGQVRWTNLLTTVINDMLEDHSGFE